jgi:hypothetical protein
MLWRAALPVPCDGTPATTHRRSAARATTAVGTARDRPGRDVCSFLGGTTRTPWRRPVPGPLASPRKLPAPGPHAPIRPSSRTARQSLPRRKQPMHRKAHRHAPMPGRASAGRRRCGTPQRKKDSPQMKKRCTLMHADGPGASTVLHGRHRTTEPGSSADATAPVPSACISVHLTASAVNLAWFTARRRHGTRQPHAIQNPVHQKFARALASSHATRHHLIQRETRRA